MPRPESPVTKEKMKFVASAVKSQPALSMSAIGNLVAGKFGTRLAYNKLRVAFVDAGGKVDTSKRPGKGKKKAANKVAKKAKKAKKKKVGRKKRMRRTASQRTAGRRKIDRQAASTAKALSGLPTFLVVIRDGRKLSTHEFSAKSKAIAFAAKRIAAGLSPSAIAYYERKGVDIAVGI